MEMIKYITLDVIFFSVTLIFSDDKELDDLICVGKFVRGKSCWELKRGNNYINTDLFNSIFGPLPKVKKLF